MNRNYDQTDPKSIEEFAKRLEGKSLVEILGTAAVTFECPGKGGFGQCIQEKYFGIKADNISEPDFREAGIELKTLPLIKTASGYRPKERLVLSIINYENLAHEKWETSSFLRKNNRLLIIGYLPSDKGPIFHKIVFSRLWSIPEVDLRLIREDWQKILKKIQAGLAHEISEGDTLYLGACTKGSKEIESYRNQPFSTTRARQRAFSFKQKYIKAAILPTREEYESLAATVSETSKSFEEQLIDKFRPFIDRTEQEVVSLLGLNSADASKSRHANLTKRMLGIRKSRVEEFEKGDVAVKTIRLQKNGRPRESMSFPAFRFSELVQETWDASTLRDLMERKFLFVVWQFDKKGELRFRGAKFWTMSQHDLDGELKKMWLLTQELVAKEKFEDLPKISDGYIGHVRPHGDDKEDEDRLRPGGRGFTKQCFWLNASYIAKQVTDLAAKE